MNVIIVTPGTEPALYFRATAKGTVKTLFRVFARLLFRHLYDQHIGRIAHHVVNHPPVNQANGFPGSCRTNEHDGIIFTRCQAVHWLYNVGCKVRVPRDRVTRPHRNTHIFTDRLGHQHASRGSKNSRHIPADTPCGCPLRHQSSSGWSSSGSASRTLWAIWSRRSSITLCTRATAAGDNAQSRSRISGNVSRT